MPHSDDVVIKKPSGLPAARESALSVRAATGVESRIFDDADFVSLEIPTAAAIVRLPHCLFG